MYSTEIRYEIGLQFLVHAVVTQTAILQVYNRLQKVNLSMSSRTTIRLFTQLGVQHDVKVMEWRDLLTTSIAIETESTCTDSEVSI